MDYSLQTPINRKLYVPEENEVPFAPVIYPPISSAQDQSYRRMTWLFHKPQNHAIFPVKSEKPEKKKYTEIQR